MDLERNTTKQIKAKAMRYKKPIVKSLNLDTIQEELYEISTKCNEISYFESDDEVMLNAFDGDDEEVYEFRMMFSDLCSDCEQMEEDLYSENVTEYFDIFFVAIGGGNTADGLIGYDSYERDYYGLDGFENRHAEEESVNKLMRLTKKELIECAKQCFRVMYSYVGLRYRYDCLKASFDILLNENAGYLQVIKRIEELYEAANKAQFYSWETSTKEFDHLIHSLPDEAWI